MPTKPHHFRIIAGRFRSRQLQIPEHIAVRPTLNRIRETLFNWLMNDIQDAICLDAFAGSGALGLEALSRGAEHVYFIEKERTVLQALEKNIALLNTEGSELILGSMPECLAVGEFKKIDIVFLDPPFHQDLILPALQALQQSELLKPESLIYFEVEREFKLPEKLDANWEILKYKKAGKVAYGLLSPAYLTR